MSFAVGENVGPYRITDRLGQGGMATVYRAYHANLDRYVAIKVLHTTFKDDPNFLARFQREAQIVAKLEHPSIVPIYDYNEHHGDPYLVMKFIEGETLKARLSRKPLSLEEALRMMTAVGQALTYAHEQGVLHRDVKPSNILLEKGTTPYLADFGLARMASAGESTLSQDMMLGTPQYMSPEQAQGVKDLDGASDVYSLGVVLYELVVGRVPFNADTPYAIVHDHIYGALPMPSQVNPDVPRAVEQVLLKALSKERMDRYVTPSQMVDAFREAVRASDLKELTAHSYRVPANSLAPATIPPRANAASSAMPTPAPIVGIPGPLPGSWVGPASLAGSSTAQRLERQRRRGSLWMLSGFGGLILTCLAGLFISLSTYNAANNAGLFAPAHAADLSTPASTEAVAIVPTPTSSSVGTGEAITEEATTATPDNSSTAEATPAATAVFPILSEDQAQKLVDANPNDPKAHFELAIALYLANKAKKGDQEFTTALNLGKNTPFVLMSIARQMARTPRFPNGAAAFVYAYTYAQAADKEPAIRAEAGQYLYRYAQGVRRRDVILVNQAVVNAVDRIGQLAQSNQSAALDAFAALAYHRIEQPDDATKAMNSALALNSDLPEVHLVRGILYADQSDSTNARQELNAAAAADTPSWVAEEAKKMLKGL